MWSKDEIEGKRKEITGTIKERIGEMTGNDALEHEGIADQAEGKAQKEFGKARRKLNEVIEKGREANIGQ